jgi:hypothetical protein
MPTNDKPDQNLSSEGGERILKYLCEHGDTPLNKLILSSDNHASFYADLLQLSLEGKVISLPGNIISAAHPLMN